MYHSILVFTISLMSISNFVSSIEMRKRHNEINNKLNKILYTIQNKQIKKY